MHWISDFFRRTRDLPGRSIAAIVKKKNKAPATSHYRDLVMFMHAREMRHGKRKRQKREVL